MHWGVFWVRVHFFQVHAHQLAPWSAGALLLGTYAVDIESLLPVCLCTSLCSVPHTTTYLSAPFCPVLSCIHDHLIVHNLCLCCRLTWTDSGSSTTCAMMWSDPSHSTASCACAPARVRVALRITRERAKKAFCCRHHRVPLGVR